MRCNLALERLALISALRWRLLFTMTPAYRSKEQRNKLLCRANTIPLLPGFVIRHETTSRVNFHQRKKP